MENNFNKILYVDGCRYYIENGQLFKSDHEGNILSCIDSDFCEGDIFDFFACPYGFIIHSEINIICVDKNLIEKWRFSGRDIFVSSSGSIPGCECTESLIILRDFLGYEYHLDYDGKLISEMKIK